MFVKSRLLTPGPTAVAESTRLAMAAAQPHHRSAQFAQTFKRASELLRWFWETDDDVLFVSSSGTGGMEGALRTCLREGDTIVVVTGGKFAERWQKITQLMGCDVRLVDVPWGESATPQAVDAVLANATNVRALVMVASETSTGAWHPVDAIGETLRRRFPEALLMVDGITAVGTADLSMRRHGIDVLVSGTQKAFGLPPGGSMVGMSARAWALAERDGCEAFYLDLRKERKQGATGQSAFTPSSALIIGIVDVFERWQAAGRDRVIAHAQTLAEATRAGVEALGLTLYPKHTPSPALTTIQMPEGVTSKALVAWMRDRCGVTVTAGQDHLKDSVLRIGTLGAVDPMDIIQGIAALEMALVSNGVAVQLGTGVAAAQAVLLPALQDAEPIPYSP